MDKLLEIIKAVLMNKNVIIAAVACVLLMNFAGYVTRYRKKIPKPRVKKVSAATRPAPTSDEGSDGGDDGDGGADGE